MSTSVASAARTIEATFASAGVVFSSGEPQRSSRKADSGSASKIFARLDTLDFTDVGRGTERGDGRCKGLLQFTLAVTGTSASIGFDTVERLIVAGHSAIGALDGADGIRVGSSRVSIKPLQVTFYVPLTCGQIVSIADPSPAFAGRV